MIVLENDDLRLIVMNNIKDFGKKVDSNLGALRGDTKSYMG